MEWGDFSYLIFSSSHACLQFSPFLSISTAFLSFHSYFPPIVWRSVCGHGSTDRWSKTPEVLFQPLHFPFTMLSPSPLPLSFRITRLFGTQNRAGSLSSICTVHLDGIVCSTWAAARSTCECAHQSVFCQSAWKCIHSPVHESETNLASPSSICLSQVLTLLIWVFSR